MKSPRRTGNRCDSTDMLFNSRRNFLKMAGAAAAGGITSLVPTPARADSRNALTANGNKQFSGNSEGYWRSIKQLFSLDPGITYLNTGTEGSMPRCVVNNLWSYFKQFSRSPMESAFYSEEFGYVQENNIDRTADFLSARPNEIVLTANTTQGMNLVLHGLDFEPGDEIVTTMHEHGAALSPLYLLQDRYGLKIKEIPLPNIPADKDEIISLFSDAVTKKTKALCFSHINYTTGLRMPVKELCEHARGNNMISIVDGAHAVGMLDINLDELGCDFYAASGHKWLNGPPGTGILYIRDGETNPYGLWPCNTEIYNIGYTAPVTSTLQMCGQQNTPAFRAMTDAMAFQKAIGKQKIESRILELAAYLKEKIGFLWGEKSLMSPAGNNDLCSGLVSFIPFANTEDRYYMARFSAVTQPLREQYNIYIRWVNYFAGESDKSKTYALRVSTHIFNTFREIDRLLAKIQSIVNS